MTAFSPHDHVQPVDRRQERAGARGHDPTADQTRRDVERVRGLGVLAREREDARVDHVARAEEPFFSGLEHEDDGPRELRTARVEQTRRADQHRHVEVMAARVHPWAVVREVDARRLGDRERIHVGTEQHHRSGTGSTQHGRDTGEPVERRHLQIEAGDRVEDRRPRHREIEADLGDSMQGAPQRDQVGLQSGRVRRERAHRVLLAFGVTATVHFTAQ